MERCAECGAERIKDKDCFAQLGEIIAWEYDDPELFAKHFLTVASYNMQHPSQFTEEALTALQESLGAYLDGRLTIDEIRHKHAVSAGNKKILKPENERMVSAKSWSMTIADIYAPGPVGAAKRVKQWAKIAESEFQS